MIFELLVCTVMPLSACLRYLGVPAEGESEAADADAFAAILAHWTQRYPALGFLKDEHERYLRSSWHKLDVPLTALRQDVHADHNRRGRVLVVCPATLDITARDSVDRRPLQTATQPVWKGVGGSILLLLALLLTVATGVSAVFSVGIAGRSGNLYSIDERRNKVVIT